MSESVLRLEELFGQSDSIELAPDAAVRAVYPAAGWASLPVRLG
jgi:hypothetical protein